MIDKTNLQVIKPFIRICERGTMAVCGYGFVKNGLLTYTNLETEVVLNTELPDGLYKHVEGEFFPTTDFEPDDFPLSLLNEKELTGEGFFLLPECSASPIELANLAASCDKDELRPVMNGVKIEATRMYASNAHRLRIIPVDEIQQATENLSILTPVPPVLISALKKYGNDTVIVRKWNKPDAEFGAATIQYTFPNADGLEISIREIEGNYPQIDSVIPHPGEYKHFITLSHTQAAELIKFGKAIDCKRFISNGSVITMQNIDTNIVKTFTGIETREGCPERDYAGIIMPMMISEPENDNVFALNTEQLEAFIKGFKGEIVIGKSERDQSRPLMFWFIPERKQEKKPVSFTKTRVKPTPISESKPTHKPYIPPVAGTNSVSKPKILCSWAA